MSKLQSLTAIVFIIIFFLPLRAQDEAAIRPIIREGDLKKLTKADTYKADAEKLIEDANRLNMEVFTVQADPSLDEKSINKKTAQLESEAQQKQVQASALYEKSNEIKFILYKQYIDEFWKGHEGKEPDYLNAKLMEEQASDNYFQATSYRIEAKNMKEGYAKVEKLTEANNLENQAIQKQLMALSAYYELGVAATEAPETAVGENQPYPSEQAAVPAADETTEVVPFATEPSIITPVEQTDDGTIPGQVEIDQSVIDSYNQYLATGQFIDTTLSTGEIAGITTFDTDQMLKLWNAYFFGQGTQEDMPESALAAADTTQAGQAVVQSTLPSTGETEIGIVTDENVGTLVPADDKVIYRVQVAANRTELSQRALSRMYYGNKTVEMINENGWYKYSVGDFETYEEASEFRKSSGVSNAFVVAYRKGTRFTEAEAALATEQTNQFIPTGEHRLPAGLIFRIQVAASRVPLTAGQMERIYGGTYPVEMVLEEGWYKYQFMGVRLYSDALQIIRSVTSNGAFIVAYENGQKINLAEAVRKNKDLEKTVKTFGRKGHLQETEFHLQLAASRVALPQEELKAIYAGSEPVSVIYEDGWYKYHLKAGNSYEMANEFKQSCGIPKAFIVPYRRAAKISYYEAIQELK